jgi:hypothetical protein
VVELYVGYKEVLHYQREKDSGSTLTSVPNLEIEANKYLFYLNSEKHIKPFFSL